MSGLIEDEVQKTFNLKSMGIVLLVGLILGLLGGLGSGWKLWSPKPAKPETPAVAVRQPDGSLVLERKPDATAKPAQIIPKGGVVERIEQVTIQPRAQTPGPSGADPAGTSGSAPADAGQKPTNPLPGALTPCPPVRVDLTLVRMPDQSRRVVASSPDGDVVGGVDIPVENAVTPRVFKWAAGGVYGRTSSGGRSVGAFLHRDAAFLRLGAEVTRDTPASLPAQWTARALVGIRF